MKLGRKLIEKVDEQESRVDSALDRLRNAETSARIIAGAIAIALFIGFVLWAF